jgi:hypothetical protein
MGLKKKLRGLVRQRTIPTKRPPLVSEVSANFGIGDIKSSVLGQILDKHNCILFLIDFSLSLLLVFILTNAANLVSPNMWKTVSRLEVF